MGLPGWQTARACINTNRVIDVPALACCGQCNTVLFLRLASIKRWDCFGRRSASGRRGLLLPPRRSIPLLLLSSVAKELTSGEWGVGGSSSICRIDGKRIAMRQQAELPAPAPARAWRGFCGRRRPRCRDSYRGYEILVSVSAQVLFASEMVNSSSSWISRTGSSYVSKNNQHTCTGRRAVC